jgi:hypothetical protein
LFFIQIIFLVVCPIPNNFGIAYSKTSMAHKFWGLIWKGTLLHKIHGNVGLFFGDSKQEFNTIGIRL